MFTGPNITPDPDHGIGGWTLDDFVNAMRHGRAPDGTPYYPAFPYGSYTQLSHTDLADLFAWLMDQDPISRPSAEQEIKALYRGRWKLRLWKLVGLSPGPYVRRADRSEGWNRGAYLVRALGHCGECHTERTLVGSPRRGRELAGSRESPEPSPNLTPHRDEGIGRWSFGELVTFLELGMTPEGDFTGAGMRDVVEQGTATLTPEDRRDIALYLRSVRSRRSLGPDRSRDRKEDAGEEWF